MEPQRQIAPATVDYVYEIAARGRASEIDRALAEFPAALRLRDPAAIALRAMKHVLGGDVPAAIALLQRAVAAAPNPDRAYLVDLLVPLICSTGDLDGAEMLLDEADAIPADLVPLCLSARAWIAASRGEDKESAAYAARALPSGRALDSATMVARVLQRVALAAFYREDFEEAQDRAVEAARAFMGIEAYRHAAGAYSVLYAISHASGDPDLAKFYGEKLAVAGKLAQDQSMENLGMVAQLGLAAETGDEKRLGSLRARLLANQLNQQYRERYPYALAEILMNGWSGRFDVARATALALSKSANRSSGELATCDALLSLAAVASWNLDDARHFSHQAIRRSAEARGTEPPLERHNRKTARLLAIAACLMSGEPSVGRKALTRTVDPDGLFRRILSENGINEADAPAMMRGYARFINAAYQASLRNRPQVGLTPAEAELVRLLPEAATLDALAAHLGKSRKTVEVQITSIYGKLDVSNRAQAVQRARDLGIAP